VAVVGCTAFAPGPLDAGTYQDNPLGGPAPTSAIDAIAGPAEALSWVLTALAVGSVVARYVRAPAGARRQLRWPALLAALVLVGLLIALLGFAGGVILQVVPFLLSVVIIAVAIWIRLRLKESPEFAKLEAKHQVTERPLANLLKNSMPNVLRVIGLRMAENGGSSIYQALAVSYIVGVIGLKGPIGALCLVFAAALRSSEWVAARTGATLPGGAPLDPVVDFVNTGCAIGLFVACFFTVTEIIREVQRLRAHPPAPEPSDPGAAASGFQRSR